MNAIGSQLEKGLEWISNLFLFLVCFDFAMHGGSLIQH